MHMSQTISPDEWLESSLFLFAGVDSLFKDTTIEVVNDQGDELWICNIAFNIPIRYHREVEQDIVVRGRRCLTRRGTQLNTVLRCLQALEQIGYLLPDFSYLKI